MAVPKKKTSNQTETNAKLPGKQAALEAQKLSPEQVNSEWTF